MSQKPEHSEPQVNIVEVQNKSGGNTNLIASYGAHISSNTVAGCTIQNLTIGSPPSSPDPPPDKDEFQEYLRGLLKRKYEYLNGSVPAQRKVPLLDIYTDQDITTEASIETIKCTDIFNSKPGTVTRSVLTKGIRGTGKTVSVQKFIIDWVERKSNQDVDFIFPISVGELKNKPKNTLFTLLKDFYPKIHMVFLDPKYNTVIILDGLHEYGPIEFEGNVETFGDVQKEASVNELLANLLKGNLLDAAHIWITSRPTVDSQRLSDYVHLVTELKGFNDQQKEEYFRKAFKEDNGKAGEVISYMGTSTSLRVLCDIPANCRILSMVLKDTRESFTDWTGLLVNFLHHQVAELGKQLRKTTGKETIVEKVMQLGKLAWQLLQKDREEFHEEDLNRCDLNADELVIFSGMCVEDEQSDSEIADVRKFHFFDGSLQALLAAMYVNVSFVCDKKNPFQQTAGMKKWMAKPTLFDVQKCAVKEALKSQKDPLTNFVRCFLGLSKKSNQKVVEKFMVGITKSQNVALEETEDINKKIINYIQKNLCEGQRNNGTKLLSFLDELKDESLAEKVKECIQQDKVDVDQELVIILKTNDEVQQEFKMKEFMKSDEDLKELLDVVPISKQAKLSQCKLKENCDQLAKHLRNPNSCVTDLDMSENELGDSGVEKISSVLWEEHCKIESLSFVCCELKSESCNGLSQALRTKTSRLRELNLSYNDLGDQGVNSLLLALGDPYCKLHTLSLAGCQLTARSCEQLTSSLQSVESSLKHLDLSFNDLQDSGIQHLSAGVTTLESLSLASCKLTQVCGQDVGVLLQSPSLKELDLTNNSLKDSGVELLFSKGLASPDCTLEKLILRNCGITLQDQRCHKAVCSAVMSEKSHLRELDLSYNKLQDSGAQAIIPAVVNSPCKIERLSLACCVLTESTCEAIHSELRQTGRLASSCLREMDLSDNDLKCAGACRLGATVEDTDCKWEKLCLSLCSIKTLGCNALTRALKKNPSHMKYVDLRFNHPGEDGIRILETLGDKSKIIRSEDGGEFRLRTGEDRYECKLTLNPNTAHQRLYLTEGKIRWGEWEVPSPAHLDRFDCLTQVLCQEPLAGRCYWEVKWSGLVSIGVAYARMARKGDGNDCTLGRNRQSWCLDCSAYKYSARHANKETAVAHKPSGCHRVGVYFDSLAGTLAFFKITTSKASRKRQFTLLHAFQHNFVLPLYAGFRIWCDSGVFICPQRSDKKPA